MRNMKTIFVAMLSGLLLGSNAWGQTKQGEGAKSLFNRTPRPVHYSEQMRSLMIGGGGLLLKDSYLSPLSYGGYTLSVLSERSYYGYRRGEVDAPFWAVNLLPSPWRTTDTRWLHREVMSFDYGNTLSPARNASIRRLQFRLDRTLSYRTLSGGWGDLFVGGGLTAGLGGLYHSRNGNNPATAKVDFSLTTSILYTYRLPWERLPIRLTLHSTAELLGLSFAQGFGENYYEFYRYEPNVLSRLHLTHPLNRFASRTNVRLDIPVWDYLTLNLGYRCQLLSWKLNHTTNRQLDHTAYIGFVSYIKPIGGRLKEQASEVNLPF